MVAQTPSTPGLLWLAGPTLGDSRQLSTRLVRSSSKRLRVKPEPGPGSWFFRKTLSAGQEDQEEARASSGLI